MKKVLKIIRYLLLLFLIFILTLAVCSTRWALNTFTFLNFDEIMFQLTSPIESASETILSSFMSESLLCAIILTLVIFIFFILYIKFISCKRLDIDVKLFKKNFNFKVSTKVIKIITVLVVVFISIFIPYICLDKITFIDYIKYQTHDSPFIEDNYVNPNDVKITFPEEKRNLIYIYAESFESSYFSSDLGGVGNENYLEPFVTLTRDNLSFSDTDKFGGAKSTMGTTWTSGAIVAHTSGLPLKITASILNDGKFTSMLDRAVSLGNILEENGYNQMFMMGSDKTFGNRGVYLENHGNVDVYDYYTAIEKGKISSDYYEWWGFEDSKLFEYAQEEITRLSHEDKPFHFSLLTTNTHNVDGYLEADCDGTFNSKYGNAIYCSSKQIVNFINWIQEQDFYDNTTIVVVGDHASMQAGFYPDDAERRIYNLFINSKVDTDNFKNREFGSLDFFPTTLASLGAEIEGDRLGLGTNLFSEKKTLFEEFGYEKVNSELSKYSSFYMREFIKKSS